MLKAEDSLQYNSGAIVRSFDKRNTRGGRVTVAPWVVPGDDPGATPFVADDHKIVKK